MIQTEQLHVEETDTELMRVEVTTETASGETREYRIGIDPVGMIDGEHLMHGTRTDGDAPDEPAGGGPSEKAWEAAAECFKDAGYELHGR